jgi:Cohesin domain
MKIRFLLILAAIYLVAPSYAAVISVQPSGLSVPVGEIFSLDIEVSGVNDLYAFQLDVDYTPSVLSAVGVTEGTFLLTAGATFFVPGTIDNVGGSISFIADTLIGAVAGVSGDGVLAEIEFTAVGPGSSPISISNEILLDSNLNVITDSVVGGSVTVDGSQVVPEPTSLSVLLAGIVVMLLGSPQRRARRHRPDHGIMTFRLRKAAGSRSFSLGARDALRDYGDSLLDGSVSVRSHSTSSILTPRRSRKLFRARSMRCRKRGSFSSQQSSQSPSDRIQSAPRLVCRSGCWSGHGSDRRPSRGQALEGRSPPARNRAGEQDLGRPPAVLSEEYSVAAGSGGRRNSAAGFARGETNFSAIRLRSFALDGHSAAAGACWRRRSTFAKAAGPGQSSMSQAGSGSAERESGRRSSSSPRPFGNKLSAFGISK